MSSLVSDLIAEVEERILSLRQLRRLLESERFFTAQSTLDMEQVKKLVQSGDSIGLKRLLKKEVKTELGAMTLRQLRKLARGRGIFRYHLLPKPILLSELAKSEGAIHGRA